mgnify:CR=1 FL=1
MRILVISFGDVKRPNNGYLIRVSTLLSCLKGTSNNVKVIQFLTNNEDVPPSNDIISVKVNKSYLSYFVKFTTYPIKLLKELKEADIIIFEGSLFVPFGILGKLLGKKVIHDFHGSIEEVSKDAKDIKSLIFRKIIGGTLDRIATYISDIVITVSDKDKEIIRRYNKNKEVYTVIHGIDVDKIPFFKLKRNRIERLIFVGDLRAFNNFTAAKKIIEIAEKMPEIQFVIVGAGSELIKTHPNNVKPTGLVSSLDPYYEDADACIIPIVAGTGIKTKVLECMAYGRPVVTTEKGIQGLEAAKGLKGVYVVKVEDMPRIIKEIELENEYKELRGFVEENFSKKQTCMQINKVLHSLFHKLF